MELTVHIPDDLASLMGADGNDLSRRALEGLALEAYKKGDISDPELLRLLGFESTYELDGFLKAHGVSDGQTLEDIEQQVKDLRASLGTTERPIWETITDLMKNVPDEVFDQLPKDGASQVDHYIYGAPKRDE